MGGRARHRSGRSSKLAFADSSRTDTNRGPTIAGGPLLRIHAIREGRGAGVSIRVVPRDRHTPIIEALSSRFDELVKSIARMRAADPAKRSSNCLRHAWHVGPRHSSLVAKRIVRNVPMPSSDNGERRRGRRGLQTQRGSNKSAAQDPEPTRLLDQVVVFAWVNRLRRCDAEGLLDVVEGLFHDDLETRRAEAPSNAGNRPPEPAISELMMHAGGVRPRGEVTDGAEVSLLPVHHLHDVRDVEARMQPTKRARLTVNRDRDEPGGDVVAKHAGAVVRDQRNRGGAMGARQQLRHNREAGDGEGAAIPWKGIPLLGHTRAVTTTGPVTGHIDARQSCLPSERAASALRNGRHP